MADVIWRCECWELMLELGGLADARPIHVKQQCTIMTFNSGGTRTSIGNVVQGYEVLVTAYLRHLTGAVPTLRGLLSTNLSS